MLWSSSRSCITSDGQEFVEKYPSFSIQWDNSQVCSIYFFSASPVRLSPSAHSGNWLIITPFYQLSSLPHSLIVLPGFPDHQLPPHPSGLLLEELILRQCTTGNPHTCLPNLAKIHAVQRDVSLSLPTHSLYICINVIRCIYIPVKCSCNKIIEIIFMLISYFQLFTTFRRLGAQYIFRYFV